MNVECQRTFKFCICNQSAEKVSTSHFCGSQHIENGRDQWSSLKCYV